VEILGIDEKRKKTLTDFNSTKKIYGTAGAMSL